MTGIEWPIRLRTGLAFPGIVALMLLGGCGAEEAVEPRQSEPRESVIGEPLQRSLDQAREVENVLQQAAEERNRRLEEAEGR